MAEDDLNKLGQQCFEEYKEDDESRKDWLKMQEEWVKLYYGKMKPLDPPWEYASDDHLPILAEGCVQFHARAYKAFFANQQFVSAMPTGSIRGEDRERAERVGKYMSWQLGVKDKTYKRRKDRLLKALPLHGSYFTKTFRDNLNRRIVIENVSPLDLVANYSSTGVDVEDLERKTQKIYLSPRLGRFYGSEHSNHYFTHAPQESQINEGKTGFKETVEKITGVAEPAQYVGGRPALILEQHRYLDLDGDGLEEPYIVWIDGTTQKVLRVAIRWSWDGWNKTKAKDPLEYFTHYVYIENPDGFYGFGQGHLVGDANIAADKLLRQIVNAGTLQNSLTGFATQQAGMKSGEMKVQIGSIKKLNAAGNIRDMVSMLQHPGASETLWRALMLITQRADRLNMVTDMLTGQPDKVYQTGTASMLVEQGLMTFSAVQIRIHAALEQELAKVYRLNGLYLDDQTYFAFNDGQSEQEYTVWRTDFADEIQVRPAFDPHQLTERERKQNTMVEYEAALKSPVIMQSPEHLTNATRRFFTGMGSVNVNEIVPAPEQVQQMAQERKNMMQAQQKKETVETQASLIESQAKVSVEGEKLKQKDKEIEVKAVQKDRELSLKSAQLKLAAVKEQREALTESKELGLEAVKTAAEIEVMIRESKRPDA